MKNTLRQLFLFLLVGALNTGTTLILIFLLLYFTTVHELIANLIGYAVGLSISYVMNRRFTFGDKRKPNRSRTRFLVAAALAYGLNISTILLSESLLHYSSYLAQVMGNAVYTMTMFAACKLFVFRPKGKYLKNPPAERSNHH
jgi:putative flippase GtrA